MQAVVILPTLFVLWMLKQRGFREALVFVLIPALLLLPNYYIWKLPGIPQFSFHNYMFVVLGAALVLGRERRLYRFQLLDLVVLFHVLWMAVSEFEMKGFADAQNLFALRAMSILVPYAIGRAVGGHNGLMVGTLMMLAVVGAGIGWVSPYEARMGRNPFDFWRDIWPTSVPWDGVLYRNGLRRVSGPFAQPICQGFYFSMMIPFIWWMNDQRLIASRKLRIVIMGGAIVGLMASLSRGPILGAILSVGFIWLGWQKARVAVFTTAILVGAFGTAMVIEDVVAYISVTRGEARTPEQETAAYRNEMLQNYLEVVDEKPVYGFGKDGFPVVKGQKSIDNQYLFLSLSHGLPAAISFLLMMLLPALWLIPMLLRLPPGDPLGRLGWVGAGVQLGAIFTQVTVFSGPQTVEVLMLLLGITVEIARRIRNRLRW